MALWAGKTEREGVRNRKGNRTGQKDERKSIQSKKRRKQWFISHWHINRYLRGLPRSHSGTHAITSLLSHCFGQSGRVKIPKVIMKFNYNSSGSGMEISPRVPVLPGAEQRGTAAKSVLETPSNVTTAEGLHNGADI